MSRQNGLKRVVLKYGSLGTMLTRLEVTYYLIDASQQFKEFYFFICTLQQLQDEGLIDGYVGVPDEIIEPYHTLRSINFSLSPEALEGAVKRCKWPPSIRNRAKKFYIAFDKNLKEKQLEGQNG